MKSLALSLAATLLFAACGSDSDTPSTGGDTGTPTDSVSTDTSAATDTTAATDTGGGVWPRS